MPIPSRSRNKNGRWRKKRSDAGKSRKKTTDENYCPRCRHYTLESKGIIDIGTLWVCSRCNFKAFRYKPQNPQINKEEKEEAELRESHRSQVTEDE